MGSIYSNGIYAYTASKIRVEHNLVVNCAGAGIMVLDVPGRAAGDGGAIPVGNNKVFSNVLVNNGWNVEFYSPGNFSDYNIFGQTLHQDPFHVNGTVAANPSKAPTHCAASQLSAGLDSTGRNTSERPARAI